MSLTVKVPTSAPLVPDDELMFRDSKVFVSPVRNSVVHLAPLTLGFDNGYCVEATGGIAMDDLIALNLGQSAIEGERVQPVRQKNRLNFRASALVCCTWLARLRVPQEPYPFAAMLVDR